MESTENQGSGTAVLDPPADAVQPTDAPPAGESGGQEASDPAALSRSMNDFMRGGLGPPDPTSKPDGDAAAGESAPDPSGDVEAGGAPVRGSDGRFVSRRGVPEAVKSAEERVAELERQLAERDPEKIREQIRNEDAQQAISSRAAEEATLYEEACRMLDTDARLSEPVPGDPDGRNLYQWREDRKELIARYPQAEEAIRSDVERRFQAQWNGVLAAQRADITSVATEYGIDQESWKRPGTTWASMTRDAVAHATAPLQDRIAALERELHNARTSGFGAARAPEAPGRSSAGARPSSLNDWLRGGASPA